MCFWNSWKNYYYFYGNSDYFILESCEYKANFLKFFPKTEIILNIDNDHLDYYKTFDNIVKTFQDFVSILDEDGLLVTNADDKNCLDLKNITKSKFISYGIDNINANFVAKSISFNSNGFPKFDVYKNNEIYTTIELSVAGKHNILNALACTAVCDYYNISKEVIKSSLKEFTGAERRLEFKGKLNKDVSIFDDYAHHPREITATLKTARNYPHNKIWCVFQPHTYTRTKAFLDEFAESLAAADEVILADIYAARETDTLGISSRDIAQRIEDLGTKAHYFSSFEEIERFILKKCMHGDLLITMGAGDIVKVGENLLRG